MNANNLITKCSAFHICFIFSLTCNYCPAKCLAISIWNLCHNKSPALKLKEKDKLCYLCLVSLERGIWTISRENKCALFLMWTLLCSISAFYLVDCPTRWSLWYLCLDFYVDHLYFDTQMTEKYSTAMCYFLPDFVSVFSFLSCLCFSPQGHTPPFCPWNKSCQRKIYLFTSFLGNILL